MGFDKKIMELSRTIYQTSVMSHGTKADPTKQIDKIRAMIREFIRVEVVPFGSASVRLLLHTCGHQCAGG